MTTSALKNNEPYISSSMQKLLNKKANIFFQEQFDNSSKLTFLVPSSGELKQIKVPFLKKIKMIMIAFGLLFLYFTKIFVVISKSNESKKNRMVLVFSLTIDQVFKDNSLYNFYQFLNRKKFNLTKKSEILIECRGVLRTKKYSNLIVALDIPLKIFTVKFSIKQKMELMLIFSHKLLILIKSFHSSQYMYLVFKEYIYDESVYLLVLSGNQVDKVITGPGNYKYQPIIFEIPEFRGERVMLWYSSNSIPIRYKSKEVENVVKPLEVFLKQMAIDTHWVWTSEHKEYLRRLTDADIFIQGSMVFYNRPKKLNYSRKYDLVIFDVTPLNSNSIYRDTIASFPVAKGFIDDIVENVGLVSKQLNRDIKIHIKHKRPFHQIHSSEYITYIDNLVKDGELSVLPLSMNLYETIAESKMIIGYPFTSPVVIGQELKIPSIYYSSSHILVNYNQSNFIQNKFELFNILEKTLGG